MDEEMDVDQSMDVEENDVNCVQNKDLSNKRTFSSINESNITKSPKKSPNVHSRHLLKAKRVVQKSRSNSNQRISFDEKSMICVLDTNILISNLNDVKNLIIKEEKYRQLYGKPSKLKCFYIPWVVVQELDHLKANNQKVCQKKYKTIANVIHFINEQLKTSNGLVKGENESKNCKSSQRRVEVETNDDKIVNCCLNLKNTTDNVILVSNDVNLCNKALMNDLMANNWRDFYQNYCESEPEFDKIKTQSLEPQNKRLAKNSDNCLTNQISNSWSMTPNISFSTEDIKQVFNSSSTSSPSKDSLMSNPFSLHRRTDSQLRHKSMIEISPKSGRKGRDVSKIVTNSSLKNDCPLKPEDWIRFRDECEQKLLKFIENLYKDIWDKDWKEMLDLNVNNTNLKEIIRLIRKDWIPNFSDLFGRDKSVKDIIDGLHTNVRKNANNYRLYYKDLKHFVELVQQKSNHSKTCDSNVKKRKTF